MKRRVRPVVHKCRRASRLILEVTKESSDVFPPLKSLSGGLLKTVEVIEVRLALF